MRTTGSVGLERWVHRRTFGNGSGVLRNPQPSKRRLVGWKLGRRTSPSPGLFLPHGTLPRYIARSAGLFISMLAPRNKRDFFRATKRRRNCAEPAVFRSERLQTGALLREVERNKPRLVFRKHFSPATDSQSRGPSRGFDVLLLK